MAWQRLATLLFLLGLGEQGLVHANGQCKPTSITMTTSTMPSRTSSAEMRVVAARSLESSMAMSMLTGGAETTTTAAPTTTQPPGPTTCSRFKATGAQSDLSGCNGVDATTGLMEVRAVHYVPRPIGATSGPTVDVYTQQYNAFHHRDLNIIANVLKANTIRIDPWDSTQDHSDFLKVCKDNGLWVIPTFDLRYMFIDPKWQNVDFFSKRSDIQTGFHDFLINVQPSDPIMGWTVNYALSPNDFIQNGPNDPTTNLYFSLIMVIRNVHYVQEYSSTTMNFLRPLMLPLDMDAATHPVDICTYWYDVENTYLGKNQWPGPSLSTDAATAARLQTLGAFDVWVPRTLPGSSLDAANASLQLFGQLYNRPYGTAAGSGTCGQVTTKAVLFQIGFPALLPPGLNLTQVPEPRMQQALIQYMWDYLRPNPSSQSQPDGWWHHACTVGGIIDEWLDDWDRCVSRGFLDDNPWAQSEGTLCDVPQNGAYTYVEWMGLASQYSFMGLHCINPRFLSMDDDSNSLCQPVLQTSKSSSASSLSHIAGAFRFEPLTTNATNCPNRLSQDRQTLQTGDNLCQLLWPQWTIWILYGVCVVLALAAHSLRTSCRCCKQLSECLCQKQQQEAPTADGIEMEPSHAPPDEESPQVNGAVHGAEDSSHQKDLEVKVDAKPWKIEFQEDEASKAERPKTKPESAPPALSCLELGKSLKIRMKFKLSKGEEQKETELNKSHLEAHVRAQERRLQYQIMSEANAVLAESGPAVSISATPRESDYRLAMRNVHLRALEGYLVWLGSDLAKLRDANNSGEWREKVLNDTEGTDPDEATRYKEVLLFRVMESLAEQVLHSPEFISYSYEQSIHREKLSGDEAGIIGTIDLDKLHKGITQLQKNADPYNGGINFDDINDCQINDAGDHIKSYYEAVSFQVVLDLIYNFQPVLVIKVWIFFLAWYTYLGNDVAAILAWLSQKSPPSEGVKGLNGIFLNPQFQRLYAIELFACLESILALFLELTVLYRTVKQFGGFYQLGCCGRQSEVFGNIRRLPSRWFTNRRMFAFIVDLACVGLTSFFVWPVVVKADMTTDITTQLNLIRAESSDLSSQEHLAKLVAIFVLGSRLFCIWVSTRPPLDRKQAIIRQLFCCDKETRFPYLPGSPQDLRKREEMSHQEVAAGGSTEAASSEDPERPLLSSPAGTDDKASVSKGEWTEPGGIMYTAWVAMLFASYLFEVNFIVPLGAGFSQDFCKDNCRPKITRGTNWVTKHIYSSDCIACYSSLTLIWILVGLTAFFDLYFIFYAGTGFFGYIMGTQRKLSNVLSQALRYLEFQKSNTKLSTKQRDGEEMERCFGKGWRKIWSRIVESLYDEHQITNAQVNDMIKAAKTFCWEDNKLKVDKENKLEVKGQERRDMIDKEFKHWEADEGTEGSFNLQTVDPIVRERLSFFMASLRSVDKTVLSNRRELMDSHLGTIPSLSQIIPCYGETVILSEEELKNPDGVSRNLAFIISQYPKEWENFSYWLARPEERSVDKNANKAGGKNSATESAPSTKHKQSQYDTKPGPLTLYKRFIQGTLTGAQRMEVRLWASMRSQTVSRTIIGALQYHAVLSLLPGLDNKKVEDCVELILASQIYGGKKKDGIQRDADVRYLLAKYSSTGWPFYLVFDFQRSEVRDPILKAVDKALEEMGYKDEAMRKSVKYASVLAKCKSGYRFDESVLEPEEEGLIEIVAVLPRKFPLLVGKGAFKTQGKSGNQLGALRFARGHVLQMMDANMGAFLGEACKVPFVTRIFHPAGKDRATVDARIIGFREFIFTERHGEVGNIMASSEWSFGTICQRFLHGIGGRMHYGHPDFLDGFWASNRGSMSKASAMINLSEDIFAGFNVRMRGEVSMHVDTLAWEKGREASFNAASGFFTKISAGSVGVMRSRDLKIITRSLSLVQTFSFFFASVGFYLNNLLIDISATVYVWTFIFLTLASKSLNETGTLQSMLASEWVVSIGVIAMFPRLMELVLECGPLEGLFQFIPTIPGCMAMFTFINKSVAAAVREGMETGQAAYIATGRPNANTHYSWRACYQQHCRSHYYPALQILLGILVYHLLAASQDFGMLPMYVLTITAFLWLTAPVIFCPQPTLKSVEDDFNEFWNFIVAPPKYSAMEHQAETKRAIDREKALVTLQNKLGLKKQADLPKDLGKCPKCKSTWKEDEMATQKNCDACLSATCKKTAATFSCEKQHFYICQDCKDGKDTVKPLKTSEKYCDDVTKGGQGTIYEFWIKHALEHKKSSVRWRGVVIVFQILQLLLIIASVPATMLDNWALMFLLPTANFALMEIWRATEQAPVVMLLSMMMWWVLPLGLWRLSAVNFVVLLIVVLLVLEVLRGTILLVFWFIYFRPCTYSDVAVEWSEQDQWKEPPNDPDGKTTLESCRKKEEAAKLMLAYDRKVIYLYTNMSEHLFHLYAAFFILIVKSVVQVTLAILDNLYGLHSWYLLNGRLRSTRLCEERSGFEPHEAQS